MSKWLQQIDPSEYATQRIDSVDCKRACVSACEEHDVSCPNSDCRHWMDNEEDLNCALVAVDKNPQGLTLRDIGERLGVSFGRICHIERAAAGKLKKKLENPPTVK